MKYKLRNRLYKVFGPYSKKEILLKIAQGKLSGDEELSTDPFTEWRKVSSDPIFFDAFLNVILDKKVIFEDEEKSLSIKAENKTKATRHLNSAEEEKKSSDKIHNTHLTKVPDNLDSLFSDVKKSEEGKSISLLKQPLDIATDPIPATKTPLSLKKSSYLVVILFIGLIYLFTDSEKPQTPQKPESIEMLVQQSIESEGNIYTQALLEEANSLFRKDICIFYEGSLKYLQKYLLRNDKDSAALGKWAEAAAAVLPNTYQKEKWIEQINKTIERGRRLDPHLSAFYRVEARLKIINNEYEEARKLLAKAMQANSFDIENTILLAEISLNLKDLPTTEASLSDALKQNPSDVKALLLSSKLAYMQKDFLKAKQYALIAQKINPIHPKIYFQLGNILLEEGKINDAKMLYESAAKLAKLKEVKVTALAYEQLSKIYTLLGDKKLAQENKQLSNYYLKGSASDSQIALLAEKKEYVPNYFKDQGKILEQENKISESVLFYQAASLVQPNNGSVFVERGEVSEKMAASYVDFQRISQMYRKAIEVEPRLVRAYVKLGLLQTEQYNLKEALELLTKAQMLAPDSKEVCVALGKHYYKRQDYTEALNYFLKAAKINPNDSETLYYAGVIRLFFKKGSQKEAAQFFSRAYQNDSKNYDALVEWMKLKVELYEKNFALKFVRALQKNDPNNPNFYWTLGEIYAANKEYRRAIDFFHRSLDFDNRSSKVRLSLAKSLEAVGEFSKAIAEYKLASVLDPRQGEGFYKASELYYQMKNYNKSEETIKSLIKVTPNYPGAYRYLSKVYQVRNQKELAVQALKKEVLNNPQNTKFRIELAELYMNYDIWDSAIAELTEITNLPSLKKAPEYLYDKITAYLLLSRCYRAQNKYDSAEGVIKLAIEIDNQDPTLHKELGYVYQGLNRDREAYEAFDFYLKRVPAAQDSQQLKSIMEHLVIEE